MFNILVTNDDGIDAAGLLALKQALEPLGNVMVLAPERNQSAVSHKKTLHKPLRIHPVTLADGSVGHSLSGTPTDCAAVGMRGALGATPDIVVSGINDGHNIGIDVTYSGTVGGAMEGAIFGAPAIAVSTVFATQTSLETTGVEIDQVLAMTGEFVATLTDQVLTRGLPPEMLLNVNVPAVPRQDLRGVKITRMGGRQYGGVLQKQQDPIGRDIYWSGGGTPPVDTPTEDNDVGALQDGFISVTPISLDMTHYAFMTEIEEWNLGR